MSDDVALPAGKHLRYSLSRRTSRGFQIGCTLVLALILGGPAYLILRYARTHPDEPTGVMYAVGGGFGLVAVILVYAAVHQLFALGKPETTVEIDAPKLSRGTKVRFFFRQPGPGDFKSLRANLVGEESWWEGVGKRRTQHVENIATLNFFDSGAFVVDEVIPFEREAVFDVPPDLTPTGQHGDRVVSWNIEVWGKVKGRADFQHVFPVTVE